MIPLSLVTHQLLSIFDYLLHSEEKTHPLHVLMHTFFVHIAMLNNLLDLCHFLSMEQTFSQESQSHDHQLTPLLRDCVSWGSLRCMDKGSP